MMEPCLNKNRTVDRLHDTTRWTTGVTTGCIV